MLNKLKTFIYSLRNSLKPSYYQDILKVPFSFSLKYFLFFFLIISLSNAIVISVFLSQKLTPVISKAKTDVFNFYPSKLNLTIKDGKLSTNVQEPYFFPLDPNWFPEELKQNLKSRPIQNIAVIDTKSTPLDISKYQTFMLLTQNYVVFQLEDEMRIRSLENVKEAYLDKSIVDSALKKAVPYFDWIVPVLNLMFFIAFPLALILYKFFSLVFISILALIFAKLFKLAFSYKKVLQLNLHAITIPTLISLLFQLFGVFPSIPFFQTIILLIFNLIIFASLKEHLQDHTPGV